MPKGPRIGQSTGDKGLYNNFDRKIDISKHSFTSFQASEEGRDKYNADILPINIFWGFNGLEFSRLSQTIFPQAR